MKTIIVDEIYLSLVSLFSGQFTFSLFPIINIFDSLVRSLLVDWLHTEWDMNVMFS